MPTTLVDGVCSIKYRSGNLHRYGAGEMITILMFIDFGILRNFISPATLYHHLVLFNLDAVLPFHVANSTCKFIT